MKQTLTIFTLTATLLAIVFMAASAGTAQADATGNETCGGSVSNNAWYYDALVHLSWWERVKWWWKKRSRS